MRSLLKSGMAIQVASALTLVAQNIVAPRLIGAEHYGTATAMLALPLLLQGLIEPLVNGATIAARGRADQYAVVRKVWVQLGVFTPFASALIIAFALRRHDETWHLVALLCFVALVMLNTAIRGLAFAEQRHRTLAAHYIVALFVTLACVPLLMWSGALGYLVMMCLVQLAIMAVLLLDRSLRVEIRKTLVGGESRCVVALAQNYVANLAPRATALVLGPGLLVVASHQLSATALAEFRVCQTLVGALAYLLPVNPSLLQAYVAASRRSASADTRGEDRVSKCILALGLLAVGLSVSVIWFSYPYIMGFLLGFGYQFHGVDFRVLILVGPFFVAGPLLYSVLLGLGLEMASLLASALCVVATLSVAVAYSAAEAFIVGSVLAALVPAALGWRIAQKRTER